MRHSERTQGFAADPDYWNGAVFAYVGSIQNLKDLKAVTSGMVRSPGSEWGPRAPILSQVQICRPIVEFGLAWILGQGRELIENSKFQKCFVR